MDRRTFLAMAAGAPWLSAVAAPSRKIKIGQIGTSHGHAQGKLKALRELNDVYELVGVVEPDAGRRAQAAQDSAYRDVRWLDEEELFNIPGLEAVAVETEVRHLVPTGLRCVQAGFHIHLDKPAGESLPAFRRLLDEAARRQRQVQMGYMFRYNPAFGFLFEAVKKGWLGRPIAIHAEISKLLDGPRRQEQARYRGGSMFELGCHLIDATITVLGKPQRVTPFARQTRSADDLLVDDQHAVLEYEAAVATVRSSMAEVAGDRRRQFVLMGTEGTVEIRPLEPPTLAISLVKNQEKFKKGTQEVVLPPMPGRYNNQLRDLALAILGEKPPSWDAAHDLAVQETVLRSSGLPLE